ncbi:hypothetical protein HDU96_001808 [Phlyctochytrium bullatum]|nr:hypothetical protein HDU96_001808 [Phlyctochytrium bullatum]
MAAVASSSSAATAATSLTARSRMLLMQLLLLGSFDPRPCATEPLPSIHLQHRRHASSSTRFPPCLGRTAAVPRRPPTHCIGSIAHSNSFCSSALSLEKGRPDAVPKAPKPDAETVDLVLLAFRKAVANKDVGTALTEYRLLKSVKGTLRRLSSKDISNFLVVLTTPVDRLTATPVPGESNRRRYDAARLEIVKELLQDNVATDEQAHLKLSEQATISVLELLMAAREYDDFDLVYKHWRNGKRPLPISLLKLQMACKSKQGELEATLQAFNELERLAEIMEDSSIPNATSYLHLITAYVNAGELDLAMETFESLKADESKVQPTLAIFNTLIHGHGLKGNLEATMSLFEEMQTYGFRPNVFTYNNLIDAYAKAGQEIDALRTLRAMIKDVKSSQRRFYVAPTVVTLNILVNMYARLGKPQEAERIIESMVGQLQGTGFSIVPDKFTLSALMNAYRRAGDMEGCRAAFERFKKQGVRPNNAAYNVLIHGYVDTGNFPEALKVIDEMKAAKVKPELKNYRPLFNAFWKSTDAAEFEACFKAMRKNGVKPDAEVLQQALDVKLKAAAAMLEGSPTAIGDQEQLQSDVSSLLGDVELYLDDVFVHKLESPELCTNALLILMVQGKDGQSLVDAYTKLFQSCGVVPSVEGFREMLAEPIWALRDLAKPEDGQMEEFLLKVYADLTSYGVELEESDHAALAERIRKIKTKQ